MLPHFNKEITMKTLNCEHCNKTFNVENIQNFESSENVDYRQCGMAWSITYYEDGVVHYRERDDHEPNQGYEYACYGCKPEYK